MSSHRTEACPCGSFMRHEEGHCLLCGNVAEPDDGMCAGCVDGSTAPHDDCAVVHGAAWGAS